MRRGDSVYEKPDWATGQIWRDSGLLEDVCEQRDGQKKSGVREVDLSRWRKVAPPTPDGLKRNV